MSTAKKLLTSSSLLVSIRFLQRSLGFISTLILARLLTPNDFGVVAVANLVIYFCEVISNTGLQQYIVKSEEVSEEIVNSAWTFNLLTKALIAAMLYALLPFVHLLYNNHKIQLAIAFLIPVILFRAMANPEIQLHRRNLTYKTIFKLEVTTKLIGFVGVVSIAYYSRSFWALIIGDLISNLTMTVLSYFYCHHRPKFIISNVKKQWDFSKWMMARGLVGYSRAQVDTFLVSKFFSVPILGSFNIAREFTVMPANEIIKPAIEPFLATFSEVREKADLLKQQFNIALILIQILIAPIAAFLYFYHVGVVQVLLGDKWSSAAPLMQAMVPLLITFSSNGLLNSACISLGKIRSVFITDVLGLFAIVIILMSFRHSSVVDFTWARSAIAFFTTMLYLIYCCNLVKSNALSVLSIMSIPYILSFPMYHYSYSFMKVDGIFSLFYVSGLVFFVYIIFIISLIFIFSHANKDFLVLKVYFVKLMNKILAFGLKKSKIDSK